MTNLILRGHNMTNYKEILRLYCGDYSERAIAQSVRCSRNTVRLCIERVKASDLELPIPENVTNEMIF